MRIAFPAFLLACCLACNSVSASTLYGAGTNNLNAYTLFTIDQSTAAATAVGPIGSTINDLTSDIRPESFRIWGTSGLSLIRINPTTGAGAVVGDYGGGNIISTLAFDSRTGKLYGTDGTRSLYLIDTEIATATLLGTSFFTPVVENSLGFDNTGSLYTIDLSNSTRDLYRIDTANGLFNFVTHTNLPNASGAVLTDLAMRPEDNFTFAWSNASPLPRELYRISLATGSATKIGTLVENQSLFGLAFSPAVPEPASICQLAVGALLAFRQRKR